MNAKNLHIGIVGASGFTGGEICRLLLTHRYVKKIYPISRDNKNFVKSHPNLIGSKLNYINLDQFLRLKIELNLVFLCTKSKDSHDITLQLLKKNVKVIDLSSAFRFDSKSKFKKAYGYIREKDKILSKKRIVYGITELNRDKIKKADLVSNPGCYAITAILSLAPLMKKNFLNTTQPININAINGTTGAGINPKIDVSHANATENVLTYNGDGHRHAPEIEDKLLFFFKKNVLIDLNTAHGNFRRGIYLRISLNVKKNFKKKIDREKLIFIFNQFYKDKKNSSNFIHILDYKKKGKKNDKQYDIYPSVTNVVGSNNCLIGLDYDNTIGVIKIIATSDNLLKGAAGSAIQNMNLMFGFNEDEALPKYGIF